MVFFKKQEWKEANRYFLKLLEAFPDFQSSPSVILMAGQCFLNQGDHSRAKPLLERLVSFPEESGDKVKGLFLLGWIAYREERFDDALAEFQRLLQRYPSSPYRDDAQYWVAWSHFRKKNFHKAVDEFQRLIQVNPASPWVSSSLLKMGDAYYNLKRYGSAVQTYQRVVKEHSKTKEAPEADFGILLSLLQEKKYDAFIAQGEVFLKRYPQHALASRVLMQVGEYYQQAQARRRPSKCIAI